MKRCLALLFATVLMLCLTLPVSALSDSEVRATFSLSLGDAYTVLERDNLNKHSEFIKRLGYTVSTFQQAMSDSNIYLYAATEDNDRQVQVRSWGAEDGIAKKIGDFSNLGESERKQALEELGNRAAVNGTLLESEELERDGQIFFRFRVCADDSLESETDSIGYCFDEYITVSNSRFTVLLFYNDGNGFSESDEEESRRLFDAFSVEPSKTERNWLSTMLRIFTALLMVVGSLVVVVLLGSFFRDIRLHRDRPEPIRDRRNRRR